VSLKTLNSPTDKASGKFSAELKPPADFAGDVWAEAFYPDGSRKETRPIALTTESNTASESNQGAANANNSAGKNESARSDKITGGKIGKAEFQSSQPDIKITVNVPAFQMTLWQNGKEVKTYEVGVGRKKYPIVIGNRRATQII